MDLSLSSKVSKDGYAIKKCPLDTKVFNRPTDFKELSSYLTYNVFDKNIYIFVDKTYKWDVQLPFNITLQYRPIYIGKGYFNSAIDEKSRACRHHDDLLSKYILKNPSRYECLIFQCGMTDNEASCLEAYLIWYLVTQKDFSLSRKNIVGDLINKRREVKWEDHICTFLNVEDQWKLVKNYC